MFPITKNEMNDIKKIKYDPFKLKFGPFEEINMNNVFYSYPSREDSQVEDVNLTIKKGEIVSILGYNGSGKTTTTKLLASVLQPTSGNVKLNGRDCNGLSKEEIYKYFGIGFQDFGKYGLTLKENISIGKVEDSSSGLHATFLNRARAPRHFFGGNGHPRCMGKLQISAVEQLKGTKAMTRGQGGSHLLAPKC